KFQRSNYERYLDYDPTFEKRLKKQLIYQKFMRLMQTSFIPSDLEVKKAKQLKSNQANLEFIKLEVKDNSKLKEEDVKAQITDIANMYEANPAEAVKRALKLGLKWEETGFFTLESGEVPKIGPNSHLVVDAFSF